MKDKEIKKDVASMLISMFGADYGDSYAKTASDNFSIDLYEYYLSSFADESYVKSLINSIRTEQNLEKRSAMFSGVVKMAEMITYSANMLSPNTLLVEVTSDVLPAIGTARVEDDSKLKLKNKKGEDTTWVVVKKDGKYYIARAVEPESESLYKERLNFDLLELK